MPVTSTAEPLMHLEGLGNALAEANEDWFPALDKVTQIRV